MRQYVDGLERPKRLRWFQRRSEQPTVAITIGQSFNTTFPGGVFKGNIDEVAFWNQTLSDGQIANIALNGVRGSTNQPPQQPRLRVPASGQLSDILLDGDRFCLTAKWQSLERYWLDRRAWRDQWLSNRGDSRQ